jgi:hypothetical protein
MVSIVRRSNFLKPARSRGLENNGIQGLMAKIHDASQHQAPSLHSALTEKMSRLAAWFMGVWYVHVAGGVWASGPLTSRAGFGRQSRTEGMN